MTKTYWLITEPARAQSVRIPITPPETPDEALLNAPLLEGDYDEYARRDNPEDGLSFKEWLQAEYEVQLVNE